MLARCLVAAAALALSSCSALSGSDIPSTLAGTCTGTIQNGGGYIATNVTLAQFADHLQAKGFRVSWSGSSTDGTLQAIKSDQFAGKTTEMAFEVERQERPAKAMCPDGLAVLARAKVNGEVLSWIAGQDIVLSLVEQYRNAHPLLKTATTASPSIRNDGASMVGGATTPAPSPEPSAQSANADGAELAYTADYQACMSTGDAKEGVTAGIMDCVGAEIDRQDAVLNSTYRELIRSMDATRSAQLRASERAWIKQHDDKCHAAIGAEAGGTLASIIYARCVLDETVDRSRWLARQQR